MTQAALLELSHERRARVWLERLPDCRIDRQVIRSARVIEEAATSVPFIRKAGIELLVPEGGRALYALLGLELVVRESPMVEVIAGDGEPFVESLAASLDVVRWGLADEYVDAVFDGAFRGVREFGAPASMSLQFGCAAHGEAGSTHAMFRRLAWLLVGLVALPCGDEREFCRAIREHIERSPSGA